MRELPSDATVLNRDLESLNIFVAGNQLKGQRIHPTVISDASYPPNERVKSSKDRFLKTIFQRRVFRQGGSSAQTFFGAYSSLSPNWWLIANLGIDHI